MNADQYTIEQLWEDDFVFIGSIKDYSIGLAKAKKEYIPMDEFKLAFNKALDLAKSQGWNKFVFDKSNLNVFHQPSMEWYYTFWKKQLIDLGLTQHYKILPKESWFKSSVEAGIVEIKEKHPNFDFNAFSVNYIDSLDESFQN